MPPDRLRWQAASRRTRHAARRRPRRRTLDGVWSQRSVIDYGLARRATLTALFARARPRADDACDAHPYLLRAARFHGEPTGRDCPVCRRGAAGRGDLRLRRRARPVLGPGQGDRASSSEMAHEHGEFRVYVVEVCQRLRMEPPGPLLRPGGRSRPRGRHRGATPDRVRRFDRTARRGNQPPSLRWRPAPSCPRRRRTCRTRRDRDESRLPAPAHDGFRRFVPSLRAVPGARRRRLPRAGRAARRRLRRDRRSRSRTTLVSRADHDRLLRRRQDRDRPLRRAEPDQRRRSTRCPTTCRRPCSPPRTASFYENRGISPTGIARAFWNNLRGGATQGGSTITQQYAKNAYLSSGAHLHAQGQGVLHRGQARPAATTRTRSSQDYLNTIYFGRGAYGIQTASQAYFGK